MFSSLLVAPVIEILIPSDSEKNTFFSQKLQSIRVKRQSSHYHVIMSLASKGGICIGFR